MSLCICTNKTLKYADDIQLEILKKSREEKRKKKKMENKYIKKNLIKVNGCSSEIFKDLKKLNENCKLTKFDNFKFEEDRIIYNDKNCDFCEEQRVINSENVIFCIMPTMDNMFYQITLGSGYCVTINESITEENKPYLKEFYEKCKTYESKYPTYFIL